MAFNDYMNLAEQVIKELAQGMPGLISVSMASTVDGTTLIGYSSDGSKIYEIQSAYQLEVLKQSIQSIKLVAGSAPKQMFDIMIRSEDSAYLIGYDPSNPINLFGVIVVDLKKGNIGIARTMFKRILDEFDKLKG